MSPVKRILALEGFLRYLAVCRSEHADFSDQAARIDAAHREYDEERMRLAAQLTVIQDCQLELLRASRVLERKPNGE